MLLADDGRGTQQCGCERENAEIGLKHRFDGPAKKRQLLHHARLLLEPLFDLAERPSRQSRSLDNHELVGDFTEDVRESVAMKLLILNALDQLLTHRAENRVWT